MFPSHKGLDDEGRVLGDLIVRHSCGEQLFDILWAWVDQKMCLNGHDVIGTESHHLVDEVLSYFLLVVIWIKTNQNDVDLVLDKELSYNAEAVAMFVILHNVV